MWVSSEYETPYTYSTYVAWYKKEVTKSKFSMWNRYAFENFDQVLDYNLENCLFLEFPRQD